MSLSLKIIITAILYLTSIIGGIWLSTSGRPLNTWIFKTHKLTGLAYIVFTVIVVWELIMVQELSANILVLLIVVGLLVIGYISRVIIRYYLGIFESPGFIFLLQLLYQ